MTKYSHIVSDKCGDCLHFGRNKGNCVGECANPFSAHYHHYITPHHPVDYGCFDNARVACGEHEPV